MVLSEEQGVTPITGLNVYDMVLIRDLIEKALHGGMIISRELPLLNSLYSKTVNAVKTAVDVDITKE
jgi:hypothetical protein